MTTLTQQPADMTFEQIEVGTQASFRRRLTSEDIDNFGALSGDVSPLHSDHNWAACACYKERLVHGMFLASLVSCLVGMHLPGRRSVCLSQQFDFIQPVYADEEVEVMGEVIRKQDSTRTLVIRTSITALPDRLSVSGKAMVKVLDKAPGDR